MQNSRNKSLNRKYQLSLTSMPTGALLADLSVKSSNRSLKIATVGTLSSWTVMMKELNQSLHSTESQGFQLCSSTIKENKSLNMVSLATIKINFSKQCKLQVLLLANDKQFIMIYLHMCKTICVFSGGCCFNSRQCSLNCSIVCCRS